MENLKVYVKNEAESKEVQELFFELGYDYHFGGKTICNTNLRLVTANEDGLMANIEIDEFEYKEITLQYLRDLVVLKRNSIDDATHYYGGSKYYLTDSEFYQYSECKWVNIDEYVDGMTFKKIEKGGEMKEFLNPEQDYALVKCFVEETPIPESWIEIPEGAEILYFEKLYESANHFFKTVNGKSYYKYLEKDSEWIEYGIEGLDEFKDTIDNFRVVWQRNKTTPNTSTQEKLKFIEKWLNGEKIQYILGIESEKTQSDKSQWHNFTEGAMQYIKRSDIKFREAPKYVTINGIEFKNIESILNYIKSNFDLEDGE